MAVENHSSPEVFQRLFRGLFAFVIKCTQLNTTHSNVCLQNPEVETDAFRFGLIIHLNHSLFAGANWTWLKNGLKRAISEFCIRDTRWPNLFHHLENFGNNESYFSVISSGVCRKRDQENAFCIIFNLHHLHFVIWYEYPITKCINASNPWCMLLATHWRIISWTLQNPW